MLGGDPRTVTSRSGYHGGPRLRAVPDLDPSKEFGPQHAHITALIRTLAHVSPEQDEAIEAAWYDLRGPRRFAARGAASDAASRHGRLDAQLEARHRVWATSALRCRDAAGDAAIALVVGDLVGPALPQDSYDQLLQPWVNVMGPVVPASGPTS